MRDIVSAIVGHKALLERYPVLTTQLFRGYTQLHTYAAAGQSAAAAFNIFEKREC
jgi:hypothetical protein